MQQKQKDARTRRNLASRPAHPGRSPQASPSRVRRTCPAVAVAFCFLSSIAAAEKVTVPSTGISVTVEADRYRVEADGFGWSFGGRLGGAATNVRLENGTDRVGDYVEIRFDIAEDAHRRAAIRSWAGRPGVLFTQVIPQATPTPSPFPSFSEWPVLPHHLSWFGKWAEPRFDLSDPDGPWLLFDDRGETFVLSPAANFMVAALGRGTAGELQSGIDGRIRSLPAGHTHQTLLVLEHGINRAFETWGRMLTDLQGKIRPSSDADATLASLGYWTDNGAAYYYQFDGSSDYEGTLLSIRDEFWSFGLPLGYLQLDSWWYPKGATGDWNPKPNQWVYGIATYEAHPALFPNGLAAFQERLGLPLVTHARWIDEKSQYRTRYQMSGNVAVDPAYWEDIAAYLKTSGVKTYEQDWLDSKAAADFNLVDQDAFMDQMARSMALNGITMQYCMPTPRHVLQGSKYSNLTSIRVSEDRFGPANWAQAIFASRLVSAVGIWPWVDVFKSSETADVLVATLSAGVVGASDAIGAASRDNLARVARRDGLLVKPDAPLVPSDSSFLAEARSGASPVVAFTRTDHEESRAVYLFSFRRGTAAAASFTPAEAEMSGSLFAWDLRQGRGRLVDASDPMVIDLAEDWSYQVLVPVGASGIAFVGDDGKFVPRGKARVRAFTDDGRSAIAVISFALGEDAVRVFGHSASAPEVEAVDGAVRSVEWARASGIFRITISPGQDGTARITMRRADRKAPEPDLHPIPPRKR